MAGVRVQHPFMKNCRYVVVERDRPYSSPFQCPPPASGGCGRVHVFKTHHLNLDETGAVIISQGVYDRIWPVLARDGFSITNEVATPPTIGIGLQAPEGPQSHILIIDSASER